MGQAMAWRSVKPLRKPEGQTPRHPRGQQPVSSRDPGLPCAARETRTETRGGEQWGGSAESSSAGLRRVERAAAKPLPSDLRGSQVQVSGGRDESQ